MGYIKVYKDIRKNKITTDIALIGLFDKCKQQLGINKSLQLISTNNFNSPFIIGVFVPKIIIPQAIIETLSNDELAQIIKHELTHYKRRDNLIRLLVLMLQAINWFNPILWFAFNRITKDCEIACDSEVIKNYDDIEVKEYANVLLNIAKLQKHGSFHLVTGFSKNNLKGRVINIMNNKTYGIAASLLTLIVIISISVICLTNANDKKKEYLDTQNKIEEQNSNTQDIVNSEDISGTDELVTEENGTEETVTDTELTKEIVYYIDKLKDKEFTGVYGEGYTWYTAAEELGMIGMPAIPYLIENLNTEDDYERALTYYALLLASQDEALKTYTNGNYIHTQLDFDVSNHTEMQKTVDSWWNTYKEIFNDKN